VSGDECVEFLEILSDDRRRLRTKRVERWEAESSYYYEALFN
jgi:hypothetical protein